MKFRRISFLLKLVILVLVVYGTFTLVSMREQISKKQEEAAVLAAAIADTQNENDRMLEDMEALSTDEGIASIARSELGLVSPGEIVFKEAGTETH